MIEVFALLFGCWFLAYLYSGYTYGVYIDNVLVENNKLSRENQSARILFIILSVIMICFIGLRREMNDTLVYIRNYNNVLAVGWEGIHSIDWRLGENPLFELYQVLLKTFISSNAQSFIFITAVIVVGSYLAFIRKHTVDFGLSIYFLISSTSFAFIAAAIKQSFAMAVAIWAFPAFLHGKKIRAAFILLVAAGFHPYVILYAVGFFLLKNIWDSKTYLILAGTVAFTFLFTRFVGNIIALTETIGDAYEISFFTSGGVGILRLCFYLIIPVLTFIFRHQLREMDCKFVNLCVNMSFLSACFMLIARVSGGDSFGRVANYFDIFNCLTISLIFRCAMKDEGSRDFLKGIIMLGCVLFYFAYYNKYLVAYGGSWLECYYRHISFFDMLAAW